MRGGGTLPRGVERSLGEQVVAGGVEGGGFGGDLVFTHKVVFVEDLNGEIDLGLEGEAVQVGGNREGREDSAGVAGVGGGDVDEDAFVAVGESLADGGEIERVATLAAVVGASEFAGLLVGGGKRLTRRSRGRGGGKDAGK